MLMKHINIYSGERCISRILIDGGFDALEAELAHHSRVFAVMDSKVATECPASHVLAEMF